MNAELAIEVTGLKKSYAGGKGYRDVLPFSRRQAVEVLRGINLQVPVGGVFGLLGPNGAGKTTLFKILGTLILPTSGRASVFGIDVASDPEGAKQYLTYVISEERSLFWRLTGKQNLEYYAALNGLSERESGRKVDDLLSLLGLSEAADRRVMHYSTGMKQKLSLARGLLTDPDVLLLDEPTRSLDPMSARNFWQFVREDLIRRQGKTVLLATHNLEEARTECNRLAVLHRGEVKASGTAGDLTRLLAGLPRYVIALDRPADGMVKVISGSPGVKDAVTARGQAGADNVIQFTVDDPGAHVPGVIERVINAGGRVVSCAQEERSLADVLAELTGAGPN